MLAAYPCLWTQLECMIKDLPVSTTTAQYQPWAT